MGARPGKLGGGVPAAFMSEALLSRSLERRFRIRASQTQAGLAQLVEQLICNHQVAGSIPAAGTTNPLNLLALKMNLYPEIR